MKVQEDVAGKPNYERPKKTREDRWLEKVSIKFTVFVSVEDVDAALGMNLYSSAPYNEQEHDLSRAAMRTRLIDAAANVFGIDRLNAIDPGSSSWSVGCDLSFDYPSDSFVKVVVEVCISHRASAQKLLLKEHSAICTFATTERMLDPIRRMMREFFDGRRAEARKFLLAKRAKEVADSEARIFREIFKPQFDKAYEEYRAKRADIVLDMRWSAKGKRAETEQKARKALSETPDGLTPEEIDAIVLLWLEMDPAETMKDNASLLVYG
jgi:hypothetical protein